MNLRPFTLAIFSATMLTTVAQGEQSKQTWDPVTQDPPNVDERYPSSTQLVTIPSSGSRMIGLILVAQGAGPHPTAAMLHGFPGAPYANLDIAQAIRRAGWNVLLFQYRGAWASEGAFSFSHVLEDVATALAFLRSQDGAMARGSRDRIVLIGHSMGGWAALMGAARDQRVEGVASIAGWNVGGDSRDLKDPSRFAIRVKETEPRLLPLRGTSAEALVREWLVRAEEWDLLKQVPALVDKPVLLIGGRRDEATPLERHHLPLVAEFQKVNARRLTSVVLDADHVFSDKRFALARAIVTWLGTKEARGSNSLIPPSSSTR